MSEAARAGSGRASSERLLVVAPQPPAPSQAWMARSLEALRDRGVLAGFAGYLPADLDGTACFPLTDSRLARTFGTAKLFRVEGLPGLLDAVEATAATAVVIHFANLAELLLHDRDLSGLGDRPVLVQTHGYDVTWSHRVTLPIPLKHYGNGARYRRRVFSLAPRVLFMANSGFTRDRLVAAGLDPERVVVKHVGVALPDGPPDTGLPDTGLPDTGLPDTGLPDTGLIDTGPPEGEEGRPITIVHVGRLVGSKGPVETIRAFDRARGQGLDARLVLIGDGPLRSLCRRAVRQARHGRDITLRGVLPHAETLAVVAGADLVTAHHRTSAYSGQIEAFGVSLVEAMALGKPVVTGASGGPAEIVVHDRTGILFEPGDVDAHADALLRLGSDRALRRLMGSNGRVRAAEKYSLEHDVATLLSLVGSERARLA